MLQPLVLRIADIKNQTVTVTTVDGQTWSLPQTAIHGQPKVGQELRLIAAVAGAEDAGTTAMARSLLNEIFDPKNTA